MNLVDVKSIACPNCGAAVRYGEPRCQFCGTPIDWDIPQEQAEAAPVVTGAEKIVDYYAMIGYYPSVHGSLTSLDLKQMVLQAQQNLLMSPYSDPEVQREKMEELEVGGWILTDDQASRDYDSIMMAMRLGNFTEHHVALLHDLQNRARKELGIDGDEHSAEDMLQQGIGYQALGMHREAIPVLQRAVELLPDNAQAHYHYGLAILSDGNAFSKTTHEMRQAMHSFETAMSFDPTLDGVEAYALVSQAMLARESSGSQEAEQLFRRALHLKPDLGLAWRGLAKIALQRGKFNDAFDCCRRAILQNPRDEYAYMLLVAACWRAGQHEYARDAANRVAALRGSGWNANRVLREVVGG